MSALFIKLHPHDNVVVSTDLIMSGSEIELEGKIYRARTSIPRYFKVAAQNIEKGARIIKCGMSIGVAVESIAAAELVHTHNIKSDYVASFTGQE